MLLQISSPAYTKSAAASSWWGEIRVSSAPNMCMCCSLCCSISCGFLLLLGWRVGPMPTRVTSSGPQTLPFLMSDAYVPVRVLLIHLAERSKPWSLPAQCLLNGSLAAPDSLGVTGMAEGASSWSTYSWILHTAFYMSISKRPIGWSG